MKIPTHSWSHNPETLHSEAIERTVHEMNSIPAKWLLSHLQDTVRQHPIGTVYSRLSDDSAPTSTTDALVMFNPFANGPTPNMLARSEFIRRAHLNAGVTDQEGRAMPLYMIASPGVKSTNFIGINRDPLKEGQFDGLVDRMLAPVYVSGVGRVSFLGFSQGADLALVAGNTAHSNLDVITTVAGEPAGVEVRSRPKLVKDFLKATKKDLEASINATGLDAQREAFGSGTVDFLKFGASFGHGLNQAIYEGLGKDLFEDRVINLMQRHPIPSLTIGYGTESAITKPLCIEPKLLSLDEQFGDTITSIRVEGANHAWGDNLGLLAKFYLSGTHK